MLLLSPAQTFFNLSGTLSVCQMVWIRLNISVMIWVKTVCKYYQQMTNSLHSLYNTLPYNMDVDKTQSCYGSQIFFYNGILQRSHRKLFSPIIPL